MSALELLAACEGSWVGTYVLQDPATNLDETSPTRLTLARAVGDRFVRLDYTWNYKGRPQQGTALIGFDPATHAASMHWADSWHMGRTVMACAGTCDAQGVVDVRGTYAAPPTADWGWRTVITPGDQFRLVMYNISPDGQEDLAVSITANRDRA